MKQFDVEIARATEDGNAGELIEAHRINAETLTEARQWGGVQAFHHNVTSFVLSVNEVMPETEVQTEDSELKESSTS